jgi:DDE superfamily endonuclease
LQPHKNEYWLFPRITDWAEFTTRVALICQLILETVKGVYPKRHLVSIDEKTSIQALERIEGHAPASKGGHKRREFEYKRHGTTCLMAALDIGTGKICAFLLNPTRTEADFAGFIAQTIEKYPMQDELILMTDSLNTHVSETLVRLIAQKIGDEQDLGIKGKSGILQSQVTRKTYLETETHRIRFLLTPKHCSWLNPIENWFAKLQQQALTHGNFKSVEDLNRTIESYIGYYNRCLVKIMKWKFKGFDNQAFQKAA